MNLFKSIFNKHLERARTSKELEKLASDVSPNIKGRFTWKQYDASMKNLIAQQTNFNAVTVGGKSNIIRLLAQSLSPRIGNINPAQLRISKMAFGNALPTDGLGGIDDEDELALHYYDLFERSARTNNSLPTASSPSYSVLPKLGAGGLASYTPGIQTGTTPSTGAKRVFSAVANPSNPNDTNITFRAGARITYVISGAPEFPNLIIGDATKPSPPPTHKKVVIELHGVTPGAGEANLIPANSSDPIPPSSTLIQRIQFNTNYNKGSAGNLGVSTRGTFAGMVGSSSEPVVLCGAGQSRLYFDSTDNRWKLELVTREIGSPEFNGHLVAGVRITYFVGEYNIKNSIVPRLGVNLQSGETSTARYNAPSGIEFFNVASTSLTDSPSLPIDDYMATFNVIMPANEGNGAGGGSVYYTEAFLFNERGDLFSIIRMEENKIGLAPGTPKGFIKNADTSFLLSWGLSIEV